MASNWVLRSALCWIVGKLQHRQEYANGVSYVRMYSTGSGTYAYVSTQISNIIVEFSYSMSDEWLVWRCDRWQQVTGDRAGITLFELRILICCQRAPSDLKKTARAPRLRRLNLTTTKTKTHQNDCFQFLSNWKQSFRGVIGHVHSGREQFFVFWGRAAQIKMRRTKHTHAR